MFSTHFVTVEDDQKIALDWTESGENKGNRVAVFVHGFASNRQGEKAAFFAERFCAAGWNFLSLDMRGHGDSSGDMEGLTLTRCIADLATALDWLPEGSAPPLLIPSSMGAAVAAWYHVLNPGRVGAMAFIAPSFSFPHQLHADLTQTEMDNWRESGLRRVQNEWLDVQVGYGLMEDAKKYDLQRMWNDYDVPTLIFHGIRDDAVPWQSSRKFLETCPCETLDLLLIKEGDHRLTDFKTYMFDSVLAWLNRIEG